MNDLSVVTIIPARGGSKGIPRKCIRPLAGKPMIYYAIRTCIDSGCMGRVVVSTDDEEIAMLSERFGATVLLRPAHLADDVTPLDPVIAQAVQAAERGFGERYDLVFTVQPTSPLIRPVDLEQALAAFASGPQVDTVLSVTDDRHLTWTIREGRPVPEYASRVNRQLLPPRYRETGAIIACRRGQLEHGTRIGANVRLVEVPAIRSIDIDSFADLQLCESLLSRRRVVFTVVGYPAVGLGHAYRALMLAHELVQLDIHFLCERRSGLAADVIRQRNYRVEICDDGELLPAVLALEPDLVINDVLDTEAQFVRGLRSKGCKVVNFEDLGPGSEHAHLVVNALYDPHPQRPGHLAGPQYFCLRDEFLYAPSRPVRSAVERVLVTFGGVDENDLTARILRVIAPLCAEHDAGIDVVVGPGYRHCETLTALIADGGYSGVNVVSATSRISDIMARADVAITSGGRTVFELASLRVPTLVICQNERELTHRFASWENGVSNLGLHASVSDARIASELAQLLLDAGRREEMSRRAAAWDLAGGKRRVAEAILALLD